MAGEGSSSPLTERHWIPKTPLSLLLEANRELWDQRQGLQGLERLVKTRSSETLPAMCSHGTGLGKELRNKWEESIKG